MKFDEFWGKLVDKAVSDVDSLSEEEATFYRLTCIRGETMVDGIEAYFERRFSDYEKDMATLEEHGFKDLANDYRHAKSIMYGDNHLTEELVEDISEKLLDEDPSMEDVQQKIDEKYQKIIDKTEKLDEYRIDFGIKKGFFEDEA